MKRAIYMTDNVLPADGIIERDQAFYGAALRETASKTAGVVGEVWFRTLVQSLAESFKMREVFIAEFAGSGNRVKELARYVGGEFRTPGEWDIIDTPCRNVIEGTRTHYREGVGILFPRDKGYEGYLGVPLLGDDGSVMGHLALLDTHKFEVLPDTWVVLQTFAARAAVELSRRRTRNLLDSMMDSVIDAIVIVNPDKRIDLCNSVAERMFELPPGSATSRSIIDFLDPPLQALFDQYAIQSHSVMTPLWSRGDLTAVRSNGKSFPVDLTVTPTEFGGKIFFTMVFRDLQDRQEAERTLDRLTMDNALLQDEIRERQGPLIGNAPVMLKLIDEIEQVAPTDATVLVTGETGTGKELVATALHELSQRSDRILVKLNCATLPRDLIESELFGHEKGAFTGASQRKRGRFELADGGTIFLDELGELSLDAQAKLLRVLQEREVERLGGDLPIAVDVRVIAATNRDLAAMVADGTFRSDLYYRLEVFPLTVPPLRERREDISTLAEVFLDRYSRSFGKTIRGIDAASLQQLQNYAWPGNVRELQNVIERATILARSDTLSINLEPADTLQQPQANAKGESLDDVQRTHITRVLEQTSGVIDGQDGAAAILGLHPNTLRSRMKKLGVTRE